MKVKINCSDADGSTTKCNLLHSWSQSFGAGQRCIETADPTFSHGRHLNYASLLIPFLSFLRFLPLLCPACSTLSRTLSGETEEKTSQLTTFLRLAYVSLARSRALILKVSSRETYAWLRGRRTWYEMSIRSGGNRIPGDVWRQKRFPTAALRAARCMERCRCGFNGSARKIARNVTPGLAYPCSTRG